MKGFVQWDVLESFLWPKDNGSLCSSFNGAGEGTIFRNSGQSQAKACKRQIIQGGLIEEACVRLMAML